MLGVIKTFTVLDTIFSNTPDLVSVYSTEDFVINQPDPVFVLHSYISIDSPMVLRALESYYGNMFKLYTVIGDGAPILDGKKLIWRNGLWQVKL